MIATLVLVAALQLTVENEVVALRGRVAELETEVGILTDRMTIQAEQRWREEERDARNDVTLPQVVGVVTALLAALRGGQWAAGRVTGHGAPDSGEKQP